MGNRSKRKRKRIVEEKLPQKWQPLQKGYYPPGPHQIEIESQPGYIGVFRNNLYQVQMREFDSEFGNMIWLMIRRTDSEAVHDWRHLQRIKNELCGDDCEAVEIYPAESRLVDASNQYHLFVFPKGYQLPFGYEDRDVSDVPYGKNKNRPFDDPPPDLNDNVTDDPLTQQARVRVVD